MIVLVVAIPIYFILHEHKCKVWQRQKGEACSANIISTITSSDEVFCVHSNNIMEDSESATFAVNLLISY